jgi:hypothetical protein
MLTVLLVLWLPWQMHAQQSADECKQVVHEKMAIEHRIFRSVVFGEPKPEDAPIGHVTFSKEGDSWIKTADSSWNSLAEGYEDTTWSNTQIKNQTAIADRRGILETKRLATSDLVPYIVAATNTFDCRMRLLCRLAEESFAQESTGSNDSITITLEDCEEQTFDRIPECSPTEDVIQQRETADIFGYCSTLANTMLRREQDLLAMTVEYDAGYRSTLQFAGVFDFFVKSLQISLDKTVRQVTNVIGSLQKIPCFLSSCEDYPLETSTISGP